MTRFWNLIAKLLGLQKPRLLDDVIVVGLHTPVHIRLQKFELVVMYEGRIFLKLKLTDKRAPEDICKILTTELKKIFNTEVALDMNDMALVFKALED